ncbi:MAG TPA: hypothetical protein VFJ43_15235 [Bacteroidia bacterium]|nr:hypothetical protein [Bacteroidia bacterium]
MKFKFLFTALLVSGSVFACHDQRFGLALNQRSFYNPASLCPYCKGSTFLASGLNFMPGIKNDYGMYYAFGNDEDNIIHGPWDIAYSTSKTSDSYSSAFSLRYAYAMQFGKWKAALGMRGSFYSMRHANPDPGLENSMLSAKLFDSDAGIMVTNQKGLFIGISMLHLGSPGKIVHTENGMAQVISTEQTLNVMGGYTQKISDQWDVLPDLSFMNNKTESVLEPGAMIRFKHHYALGTGVTFASNDAPSYEIRGGYMSSKFKWLTSAYQTPQGWSVETGIVWRFWFTQECDGGVCTPKPNPWKKLDDFVRHR